MLETSAWLLLSLLQIVHAPAAFVRGRLPIPVEVQSLDETTDAHSSRARTIRRCSPSAIV
jgi:hypothetical protein